MGSLVDFIQERLNPWILCLLIMNEIPIAAQQLIIDSIKKISSCLSRVILCNDAGWLSSDVTCQVCTHDKFEDYLLSTSVELVTVFPSIGSIRRTLKSYKDESFSFEAVFACHHAVDPFGIAMEVLSKFGTDCKYIQAIHFLVDLSHLTLREGKTISLFPLDLDLVAMTIRGSYMRLFSLARKITKEGTTGSVQTKYWTNWKNGKEKEIVKLEKSLLFCRHLDHLKLGKFANFLTRCDINFICAARSTIVIDIEGIDASVLIRLMHYAELPIPTTEAQGAFSLNIRSVGVCPFNRTLLAFRASFGRIGALPSYPVQIKSKELNDLLTFPIKESAIVTWFQRKISGFNFQVVTCVNDEQHVEEYLQFRISAATPDSFPNHYSFNGVNFRIDHALPYATPISSGVRPPTAQSVHEHWKLSVQRTCQ